MKKLILSTLLILIMIFQFTACGVKKLDIQLEALAKNEALLPNIAPCCTVEEVRAAKVPLDDPPFDTLKNDDKKLESVTYLLQDEKFTLNLAGHQSPSSLFQFINGKLSNITINLADSTACDSVIAELTRLYGEPTVNDNAESWVISNWEFQAEYPVNAAVIQRTENGKTISGNFQVSYVWFGTEE